MTDWMSRAEAHILDGDAIAAAALIKDLRNRGLAVYITPRGIGFKPGPKLTDVDRDLIPRLKASMLTVLALENAKKWQKASP